MEKIKYSEFRLLIDRDGAKCKAQLISGAKTDFTLPFTEKERADKILQLGGQPGDVRDLLPEDGGGSNVDKEQAAREFGGGLFKAIFKDDVLETYRNEAFAKKEGEGIRLRLQLPDDPELADLPWEYLFDEKKNMFLAQSNLTPVVRSLSVMERVKPLTVRLPLNVLVMISNPKDSSKYPCLDVEKERGNLEKSLEPLKRDGKLKLTFLDNARLDTLQNYLMRDQYHVFHFIGHGGIKTDEMGKKGVLLLDDDLVEATEIKTILHDHETLRLAVLNSCEGARFAGVAATLVRDGIPAVVAMQFRISDAAAIIFATTFYTAIADGLPVDAAVSEARKTLYIKLKNVEWGTPVLYMRSPDGNLFDLGDKRSWRKVVAVGAMSVLAILAFAGIPQIMNYINGLHKGNKQTSHIEYNPVAVKYPETLPSYLIYTMKQNRKDLSWLQVDVKSKKKKTVQGKLEFNCDNLLPARQHANQEGIFSKRNFEPVEITQPPGEQSIRIFDFYWPVNPDKETQLKVHWTYQDEKDHIVEELNPATITILPKSEFLWDLKIKKVFGSDKEKQEVVPKDFLIASLASWVKEPDDRVRQASNKIMGMVRHDKDKLSSWFEKCYQQYFQGPHCIGVSGDVSSMEKKWIIKTPGQVLESREASQLDAALLIAAMARAELLSKFRDARLILFAVPDENKLSFILAWSNKPYKEWHALEMLCNSNITLTENKRKALALIERLPLKDIVAELDKDDKGVYWGENRFALDFEKAITSYKIAALP